MNTNMLKTSSSSLSSHYLSNHRTGVADPPSTSDKIKSHRMYHPPISFYVSHCFHGIMYYYCVKYIIQTFVLKHTTTNDNANSDNHHSDNTTTNHASIISSLAFYGVYHRTPYNQLIHLVGVPFIIWTMILYGTYLPFTTNFIITTTKPNNVTAVTKPSDSWLRQYLPPILLLPLRQLPTHSMTWATFWVLLYVTFYCYIDFIGASLYTPFLYIMYTTSVHWSQHDLQQQQQQSYAPNPYRWYGTGKVLWKAFIIHVLSWYIQIHLGHGILEGATPASLVNLGAALTSAPLFAFYEMIWYLGYRLSLQQQVLQQVSIYTEQLCTAGANLRVCNTMTSV